MEKPTEVLSLSPLHLSDVLEDIRRVGKATDADAAADSLTSQLRARIDAVQSKAAGATHRPKVLQLEWVDPLLCGGHWVVEMVELAGGSLCFGSKESGSSRLAWPEILESQPDIVLLMPCGFNLERALEDVPTLTGLDGWDQLPAVKNGQVYVLDAGAFTSRLGPRLVTGLEIMAQIIQPEIFSGSLPAGAAVRLS